MANKELQEKIVELGKSGRLTYDLLNQMLPEDYSDPDKMEEIFDLLESHGIELKELDPYEREEYIEKRVQDKIKELTTYTEGVLEEEEEGYAEPGSEELLSIYLREMGKYELLTPEREEELSRQIRGGFETIVNLILQSKVNLPEVVEAKRQIEEWKKRDPNLKPKK
ncbi:MAG: RNA polymerase subunit sigma, partial [Thermodesulfobacterium sp.]|nr:RNA polymerase subunit sigma [Thermodesulfobacterium sp.]